MAELRAESVRKTYSGKAVVDDVDIHVPDGSFCALLGPSGSGKTTLLQMVAGLVPLDGGRILIGGNDVSHRKPESRNIGVVFQSYALFPHMTVADNVAYGLKARKVPRPDQRDRVQAILSLVGLGALHRRKPSELSGGQRQRVALARALVIEPDVLLLDEPLSALDRKIRTEMQEELARIHRETALTTLMVTHDQEEALDLADNVVLLKDGQVQQAEPPTAMYRHPASPFVADFLGAQCFTGATIKVHNGQPLAILGGLTLPLPDGSDLRDGQGVELSIASEAVSIQRISTPTGSSPLTGMLSRLSFLGPTAVAEVDLGTLRVRSLMLSGDADGLTEGARVSVEIDPGGVQVFATGNDSQRTSTAGESRPAS
jgi:ABC-type Fe3+/spermidine/putrescine transport system ATPase subunit